METLKKIIGFFFELGVYNSNEYMQIIIAKILILPIIIILILVLILEILKKKRAAGEI